jgi:3-mercaptopyruvate sulfurtransferase SseA
MRVIATAVALIACSAGLASAQPDPRIVVDPKTGRAVGAREADPQELRTKLAGHDSIVIVDVRDPAEFEKETLPGAINIPLEKLKERLKDFPKGTVFVFT